LETGDGSRSRKKALKRETQERGELKKASEGKKSSHRREGSQTLRAGILKGMVKLFRRVA